MIFIAAGTQDGRELIQYLLARGEKITASVVSAYGSHLLLPYQQEGLCIHQGALDEAELMTYLDTQSISVFIDATHPYAVNVSENAMQACRKQGVPYLRYERPPVTPFAYEQLYRVNNYEAAAKVAASLGKRIFLTTGSRNLASFAQAEALRDCTLIARVLPDAEVIGTCMAMGIAPKNLIAMQGPFSAELNRELYKKYQAEVVVTKESGTLGGTDTKLSAAASLHLPIVLIERPVLQYPAVADSFAAVWQWIQNHRGK